MLHIATNEWDVDYLRSEVMQINIRSRLLSVSSILYLEVITTDEMQIFTESIIV
jgi:hypothetical protein